MKKLCPNCNKVLISNFKKDKYGNRKCENCHFVLDVKQYEEPKPLAPVGGITFSFTDTQKSRELRQTMKENSTGPNQKIFKNKEKITKLCQDLQQNSRVFIDHAQEICEKSNELEKNSTVKNKAIIAASIYIASNDLDVGLTKNEICAAYQKTDKKLSLNECQKALDWMKPLYKSENKIENIAKHIANKLYLHPRVVQCIYKFGTIINENQILDTIHPETRAAAIIYFVLSKNSKSTDIRFYRPISDIEKVCGVTANTIRSKIVHFALFENVLVNSNEFKLMQEAMTSGA